MSTKYLSLWQQPSFNLNSVYDETKHLKITRTQKKRNLFVSLICNMPWSHHNLSQYTKNWWVHWQATKILPYHSCSYLVVVINNLYRNHGFTTNESMKISKQLCSICVLFNERGEKVKRKNEEEKEKKRKMK